MEKSQKKYIIAIDGPCATGKSTTAKIIAKKLGIVYVDTGAMYRACAYYFISNNIEINEENAIKHMKEINIELGCSHGNTMVCLNNVCVTSFLRSHDMSMGASNISKIPYVRDIMVDLQRKLCTDNSIIMDGRDIGTVVFPNADIKVYLDADCKIRAVRRKNDLLKIGQDISLEEVEADVCRRDAQDKNRDYAPLKVADDAVVIDTGYLSVEEVADIIIQMCKDKNLV